MSTARAFILIAGFAASSQIGLISSQTTRDSLPKGTPIDIAIMRLARAVQVPIGFERHYNPNGETERLAAPIILQQPDLDKILPQLLKGHSYYWRRTGGGVQIRPEARDQDNARTFVDMALPRLGLTDTKLVNALDEIVNALVPGIGVPPRRSLREDGLLTRRFSVPDGRYTVSELLTAITVQHGASGWIVSYKRVNLTEIEADIVVGLYTFDGTSFSRSIPPRALAR